MNRKGLLSASLILTFLVGISPHSIAQTQDIWNQKTSLTAASREGAAGFSIGTRGYIGIGGSGPNYLDDFWEYDPVADVWSQKANFAGAPRYHSAGFSIGNKGYIGTGVTSAGYTNDFWEYDPNTNNWTQKAVFPGAARGYATGFGIGGRGYLGTGSNSTLNLVFNDFWEYDPAGNSWTQKANVGGPTRQSAVGFSVGTKGYIGLGGSNPIYSDFWEYNPSANTWTIRAAYGGGGRVYATGFSIGAKGYIGVGQNSTGIKNDFWEFDPAANSWTKRADYGGGFIAGPAGFSIGSKGYIGTGVGNASLLSNQLWEYTPFVIQTGVITGSPFCGGAVVNVPFTIVGNPLASGNVFTAQLSDDTGSFASAVNIGTLPGTTSGTIIATIPPSTPSGTGYRIRVVSSSPTMTGTVNTSNLTIHPAIYPTITISTPLDTICVPVPVVFTAVVVNAGASPVYQWKVNGMNAGTSNATFTYTPASGDTVTCSLSSNQPCAIPATSNVIIMTVLLHSLAVTPLSANICLGDSVVLHADTTSPGVSFQWQLYGNNIPGATGHDLTVMSTGSYRVLYTNGNCQAASVPAIVNVAPLPLLTINTQTDTICNGFLATFTASAFNTAPPQSYQWKVNGINAGTASHLIYTPADKDTITCALTCIVTCDTSSLVTIYSNPIIMTVTPSNLNVVPAFAAFCQGDSVILKGVDTITAGLNYQWQSNSNNIPGATANHFTARNTGAYSLVLNAGNCTASSAFIPVNVNPSPVPFVQLMNGVQMKTDNYNTYQWNLNGVPIAGATNKNYTATHNGAYTVTVVDANGCSGTSLVITISGVGVEAVGRENNLFNLYPNPATGKVFVHLQDDIKDDDAINLALVDITGKRIATLFHGSAQRLRKDNSLLLPPTTEGLYFIKGEVNNSPAGMRGLSIW